jgi:hypothetical protein
MNRVSLYFASVMTLALSMLAVPAHAALDAAISTGIASAQTDLLALFSALTLAGVAIWVGRIIYRKFTVK